MLVEEEGQRAYGGFGQRVRCRTLVTARHRLTIYAAAPWGEIYDLVDDPSELRNLWDDPACRGLRGELLERLSRAMLAAADPSPLPTALA